MSRSKTEIISCPKCGYEQKVEVWTSINVTLDSSLREKLFNRELNSFKCIICNYITEIETSLLYHDMTRGFAVQFYPFIYLEEKDFIEEHIYNFNKFDEIVKSRPVHMPVYIFKPHIVFSLEEMCRYVVYKEKLYEAVDHN